MTRSKAFSVTIRDVARQAEVSVATVSRYNNQTAPVSEEVAARVQTAMSALNFVPQASARRLSAHLTPPLTSVRAPTEEVGRRAAQQLLHLL